MFSSFPSIYCIIFYYCGRAPDRNGLTAEHLIRAHPILQVVFSKLFKLILYANKSVLDWTQLHCSIAQLEESLMLRLCHVKTLGAQLSAPLYRKFSNIALLRSLANLLVTIINNSAFKRRWVVQRFIKGGNTVNLCAIDLSKAFYKVNYHALLMKLMKRNLPV